MANPISNPSIITQTLRSWIQGAQLHMYNIGTLCRTLVGRVHTIAQGILGKQLGTAATGIIIAVALCTTFYALYKMITIIQNCCCGRQKKNENGNNNGSGNNNNNNGNNGNNNNNLNNNNNNQNNNSNPFRHISEDAFIDGEEGYNPKADLPTTTIDQEAFAKWLESRHSVDNDGYYTSEPGGRSTEWSWSDIHPDYIKKWELYQQGEVLITYLNNAVENLNTLSKEDFQILKNRLTNEVCPFLNKIEKESIQYTTLFNALKKLISSNLSKSTINKAKESLKNMTLHLSKDETSCVISVDHYKQLQQLISDDCGRNFELCRLISKGTSKTAFEINERLEKDKKANILILIQSLHSDFDKITDYKINHQPPFQYLKEETLKGSFPTIKNLLTISNEEFEKYKIFLDPFFLELKRNEIQTNPSYRADFNKHIKEANKLFKGSCEKCATTANNLHKELKKIFPNETPVFDESTGTVTCSAEMLLFAFGLAKKNPNFQRLASVAFNYQGGKINQQALYARLVQIVLCGPDAFNKKKVPKTGYAFKVKEIEDQKISPKEVKMTENDNSYAFTQLNTSSATTMEEKFKMVMTQYVKDFCDTRVGAFDLTFNGQPPYSESLVHSTIKNNEMLKRQYTTYLKTLSKEELQKLIQDAKDSSLIKEALLTFAPNEKDLLTSDFPLTILEKMFEGHLDNELVQDTLSASSLDPKDLEEIAEKHELEQKAIEPLLRYKVLEHLCFRSQSAMQPLVQYPQNLNKNNLFPIKSRSIDSSRTLDIGDISSNSATLISGIEFYEMDPNSGEPVYYAMTQVKQEIKNLNKDSKVSYQLINDLLISPTINQDAMTLLISQADPTYLEKIRKKEMINLQVLDDVKGSGTVVLDEKGCLKAKNIESKIFQYTWGLLADYKQPDLATLAGIRASFQHLLTTYRIWDQTLSNEEKIAAFKGDIRHALQCQYTIDAALTKVFSMVSDQSDKQVKAELILMSEHCRDLNDLLTQWEMIPETTSTNLNDWEKGTDYNQEFLAQIDEEKVQSIGSEQAPSYIGELYDKYSKKFTSSDKPEDFLWKTKKYDAIILNIQNFVTTEWYLKGKTFNSGTKDFMDSIQSSETEVGKALHKMLSALSEMKVDPKKRPLDYETLHYQERVRKLFQSFFSALEDAAEKALEVKKEIKEKNQEIENKKNLFSKNKKTPEEKYADMILNLCHHLVMGANLDDAYTDSVKTFYPDIENVEGKKLTEVMKEAYESIKNADACRKTPVQDGAFKSLKGHFNVAFNGWFAGNPVSQFFKITLGKLKIDFLAFGSPTNENSPTSATILNIFKAWMQRYKEQKKTHLYVSVQNLIPVDEQGWKKWFKILPNWLNNWCQTIVGGDETNRIQALMKCEDECDALYFMNLSMNSSFYKHPVKIVKGNNGKFDEYETAKNFKKALIEQIFDLSPETSGNYISKKIRDAFKKKTGKDIQKLGDEIAQKIHESLFTIKEEGEFKGSPLNTLTEDQRKCFIEAFYNEFTLKVAQALEVESMNESCKDDIDRGIVRAIVKCIMICVANGKGNDKEFIKKCVVKMLSRALQARQREIIDERYERIMLVADFMIDNATEAGNLYKKLWGDDKVEIEM